MRLRLGMMTKQQKRIERRVVDGVLLLDKPSGLSSNHALQQVRRMLSAKKAGHTGTLDPLASGLLPLCFGEATKFAGFGLDAEKTYCATLRLGIETSTADAEGEVIAEHGYDHVTPVLLNEVMSRFIGVISQVPPMYSALKYQGKPLYHYALKGETVERAARTVEIFELYCTRFQLPQVDIMVRCSKGTYVRTLAEDIGRALECGAHLAALRRTASGGFDVSQAHSLETLATASDPEALLLPLDCLVAHLPSLSLSESDAQRLYHGQSVMLDHAATMPEDRCYRLFLDDASPRFLGLGKVLSDGVLQSTRLLSIFPHRGQ